MATVRELIAKIKIQTGGNLRSITNLTKAVSSLREELVKLSSVPTGNLRKIALSAGVMRRGFGEGAKSFKKISDTMSTSAVSSKKFNNELNQMGGKFGVLGRSMETSVGGMRKFALSSGVVSRRMKESKEYVKEFNSRIGASSSGFKKFSNSTHVNTQAASNHIRGLELDFRNLLITTGTIAAVKSLVDLQTSLESTKSVFKAVTGSVEKANEEYEWSKNLAKSLGQEYVSTTRTYAKFYAATKQNLPVEQIREIFKTFQEASVVLGMSKYDTELIMFALEQMASKGVVSMEELRRQLGERLFGSFSLAAKAMGLTEIEFNNLIKSGKLLSKEFLPIFAKQIKNEFNSSLPSAMDSTRVRLGILGNAFTEFQEKVLGGGFGEAITKILINLTALLKSSSILIFMGGVGKLSLLIVNNLDRILLISAMILGPRLLTSAIGLLARLPISLRMLLVQIALVKNLGGGIIPIIRLIFSILPRFLGPIGLVILFLPNIIKLIKNIFKESSEIRGILDIISSIFRIINKDLERQSGILNTIGRVIEGIFSIIEVGIRGTLLLFKPLIFIIEELQAMFEGKKTLIEEGFSAVVDYLGSEFIRFFEYVDGKVPTWLRNLLTGNIKSSVPTKGYTYNTPFSPPGIASMQSAFTPVGSNYMGSFTGKGVGGISYGNVNIKIDIPKGQDPKTMDSVISKGINNGLKIDVMKSLGLDVLGATF